MKESSYTLDIKRSRSGILKITIGGSVVLDNVKSLYGEIDDSVKSFSEHQVEVDLSAVESIDSSGAAMLLRLRRFFSENHARFEIISSSEQVSEVLKLIEFNKEKSESEAPVLKDENPVEKIGIFILAALNDFTKITMYIGRVSLAMFWSLDHPFRIRWKQIFTLIYRTGSQALPIVGLMSMLVGMVTAFSSAVQLRQFGANIFIANLVGIGMTREMGPLMAAILLAGRSGSAFAAEIGTMKISDELDALTVMGILPLHYLIIPRMIAMMIVMPMLALYADVFGIFGGMIISIASLDLTPTVFLNQLQGAIGLWDVFSGVLKSFFFGLLIAVIGCYRGLQTGKGALGVGISTTSSVVSSIFMIVLADSTFVILFHYLEIG